MKKTIGYGMLILFFAIFFGLIIWVSGLKEPLLVFGSALCALAFIIIAIVLIAPDK